MVGRDAPCQHRYGHEDHRQRQAIPQSRQSCVPSATSQITEALWFCRYPLERRGGALPGMHPLEVHPVRPDHP